MAAGRQGHFPETDEKPFRLPLNCSMRIMQSCLPFLRQHGARFAPASGPNAGAISIQLKIVVSASAIVRCMAIEQYIPCLPEADHKPDLIVTARVRVRQSIRRAVWSHTASSMQDAAASGRRLCARVQDCLLHFQQEPAREYIPEYI